MEEGSCSESGLRTFCYTTLVPDILTRYLNGKESQFQSVRYRYLVVHFIYISDTPATSDQPRTLHTSYMFRTSEMFLFLFIFFLIGGLDYSI